MWERFFKDVPEVTKDDREIVSALRAALADKVGKQRFDLWFGAGTRLDYDGQVLRIGAPNRFFLEWIRANFRRHIEGACTEVLGKCPSLEFQLDVSSTENHEELMQSTSTKHSASTSGEEKRARPSPRLASPELQAESLSQPAQVSQAESIAIPPQRSDKNKGDSPIFAETKIGTGPVETKIGTGPADTIGTVPSRRRFASLDSFVAGEANQLAIASAQMVVRQPGQLTPLMFHGPTSVGKTHLLEGIWTASRRSHQRLTTVYLSSEQFTSHFLEALRGSGLPSFRRKYRGVGLLILDDLQFFVGKRATQVELLHTIDTFLREGRQLVFAADRSPADLAELGPELTTRLGSGLVCRLEPPDHSTRLGIVGQMAKRMKLQVPLDVRQYMASRLTNQARELSGALCRLQATSESLGKPISLAMAEEALADLVRNGGRAVRLADIEKAVCDVFGLEPASLQSDAKEKRVSHPRMLAMWLARKHTRAALSEIGHFFGHRSHSTVISAQKRVDGWMASSRPLDLAERHWPVDDAIRQVERRLSAG